MWFSGLDSLVRVLLVGTASYLILLVILRITGARSLAKLNAFDFTVTIALGSILATAVTSADLPWASAATAIGLLLGLQFLIAKAIRGWPALRGVVTATPIVIVRDGQMLPGGMRRARVGPDEVFQAARAGGYGDVGFIGAMIMETDGTLSVISTEAMGGRRALEHLDSWH